MLKAKIYFISFVLAILACGSLHDTSIAQDSGHRFTFASRGEFLVDALVRFRTQFRSVTGTELQISWDPLLVEGKRTFCAIRNEPIEPVLACIFGGTGLTVVQRLSGLWQITITSEGPPLYGNLRGIILDAETEQPVPNAHVLLAGTSRGRVANSEGMFLFASLLQGSYQLNVSHIGYRSSSSVIDIAAGGNLSTEVVLVPNIQLLDLIIVDGPTSEPSSTLLGSGLSIQEEFLDNIASGTSGILQSIDAMTGVHVSDATADVHIQGGEAGEHQFRLDGVPVFIPINVATFIGPFSPFALGKIRVNKAGFNVTLGSHTSGVIEADHDLRVPVARATDASGRYRQDFAIQVDQLSTNARYRASWSRQDSYHVTYMSAARVGMWQISPPNSLRRLLDNWNTIDTFLLPAFADRNTPFSNLPPEGQPTIGFVDWHNAARIRFGNLKTIYASTYWGSSSLGNDLKSVLEEESTDAMKDIYRWQNGAAQVRYEAVLGSHTFGSLRARGSLYRLKHDFIAPDEISETSTEDDGNRIYEFALDGRLDYMPVVGHHIELGTEITLTGSRFTVAGTQLLPLRHSSNGWRAVVFTQDKMQLGQHAVVEAGTRFTYLNSRKTLYAEPRLSFRFDWQDTPIGGVSLFLGTGVYRQFVNQFDVSSRSPRTFVSSTRFWMGVDQSVIPPKAGHLAAEVLFVPDDNWSLRFEGHYKKLYHVLTVDYSADVDESTEYLDQSQFLKSTDGYSYGTSTMLKRKIGPGSAHIRFDYTRSRRRVEDLFRSELLTVPWNEPYRLEFSLDIALLKRIMLLGRWKSIWGRTWGFRQSYYDFLSAHLNDLDALLEDMRLNGVSTDAVSKIERQVEEYDLTHPEAHSLSPIHQLDFSIAYNAPFRQFGLQIRLDVINVLNRVNTAEWRLELDPESYYGSDPATSGLLNQVNRPLLPRVFSLAAKLTW